MTELNPRKPDEKSSWAEILKHTKTPLPFLALAVLCAQVIMLAVIYKSDGNLLLIVTIAACVVLMLPVTAVSLGYARWHSESPNVTATIQADRHSPSEPTELRKVRLFISTPMTSYNTDTLYRIFLEKMRQLLVELRRHERVEHVYYINEKIPSLEAFEKADLTVPEYFNEIANCDYFIVIIEKPALSSVYFEAGYALGLDKRCIYFIKDPSCLPYLMKHTPFAYPEKIRLYEYNSFSEIAKVLQSKAAYN